MPKVDPCKVYACALQTCLEEKHYQTEKCQNIIEDFKTCCRKWKKDSFVCEGIKYEEDDKPK